MVYILNVEIDGTEERAGWNGEDILMMFICFCNLSKCKDRAKNFGTLSRRI